tara:strand:- start:533 stop:808 length:276 start_codon:yes stop_codon:yes gene_type:complete
MIQQTIEELAIKAQALESQVIELQGKLKELGNRKPYTSIYEVSTANDKKIKRFDTLTKAVCYYQKLAQQYVEPPMMYKVDSHIDLNTYVRI